MLWPIFVLFGPWWWILVIVASIWIIAAIESENGFGATVVFIAAFVAMTVFGTLPIITWVTENPWLTAGIVGAYLFIGGPITGVIRWFTFVHDELEKYENKKRSWLKSHNIVETDVPEYARLEWLQYISGEFSWLKITGWNGHGRDWDPATVKVQQCYPRAWDYKARIVTWMMYWPWTLFWTLLDDVISRWFKIIQQKLSAFMDAISRSIFKRVKSDFELPTEPDESMKPEQSTYLSPHNK
jgi:hypothetical protein